MPDFSVVIASYNEGTKLLATMAAVAASLTGDAKVELVVADDCSSDGSGSAAAKLAFELSGPQLSIKVVRAPSRFGTARAKNFGQRQTTGPITVTLDAHTIPAHAALERMVLPLTRDDGFIVTARKVDGELDRVFSG